MRTIQAIAFDMYGTLFDVHSVASKCEEHFKGRGKEISLLWRQKQLEYSWLRSLMHDYVDFEIATEDALRFTCNQLGLKCDAQTARALNQAYLQLEPFPEVPQALAALRERGLKLAVLTNGSRRTVHEVVHNASLQAQFTHLISVEEAQVFKPHPLAYELGEKAFGLNRRSILFVSSNSWDATGAKFFGYPVCWVNRGSSAFDEIGQVPDHVVGGLDEIVRLFD